MQSKHICFPIILQESMKEKSEKSVVCDAAFLCGVYVVMGNQLSKQKILYKPLPPEASEIQILWHFDVANVRAANKKFNTLNSC